MPMGMDWKYHFPSHFPQVNMVKSFLILSLVTNNIVKIDNVKTEAKCPWDGRVPQVNMVKAYLVIGDILYMKHIPKCTYCENR